MAALIHQGTWTTLQAIDIADITDGDWANIYYDSRTRTFVFDITSIEAENNARPGPFYLRPHDYSTGGVWVETIGNDIDVFNAGQIIGDILQSTNWGASTGSRYNLNDGTIQLGGSAAPKFSVSATGVLTAVDAIISGAISAGTINIGGDDTTSFHVDATGGIWSGSSIANKATAPFRVSSAGALVATSATISGTITATAGTVGGFTINGTSGLYAGAGATRVQMKPGAAGVGGIWTGGTLVADAKNYLDVDGSGWLADGNISWDAAGLLSLEYPPNIGGSSDGIIFKDGKRWLYDFNPGYGASAQPEGFNSFMGIECGNLLMGATATATWHASYNLGVGYQVLKIVTKGAYNVGIGDRALLDLTEGSMNVAVGRLSGANIIAGDDNVAIGSSSLYNTTSGDKNIAIGRNALENNTSGSNNIAIGYAAGSLQSDLGTDLTKIGRASCRERV